LARCSPWSFGLGDDEVHLPPLMKIIEERQQKIAAGIEAAERSQRELEQLTKISLNNS